MRRWLVVFEGEGVVLFVEAEAETLLEAVDVALEDHRPDFPWGLAQAVLWPPGAISPYEAGIWWRDQRAAKKKAAKR